MPSYLFILEVRAWLFSPCQEEMEKWRNWLQAPFSPELEPYFHILQHRLKYVMIIWHKHTDPYIERYVDTVDRKLFSHHCCFFPQIHDTKNNFGATTTRVTMRDPVVTSSWVFTFIRVCAVCCASERINVQMWKRKEKESGTRIKMAVIRRWMMIFWALCSAPCH